MANTPSVEPAPPRDSVWTKYSPNHEFPLAGAASFVLHGLVVVAVLLFGLALQARWHGDATTSPKLDVALVQAPEGDGLPPGGGSPPGTPGETERIEPSTPSKSVIDSTPPPVLLDSFPSPQLQPSIDLPPMETNSLTPDLKSVFEKLDKDLKFSAEPKVKAVPKGQGAGGGQGGGGVGSGKGPRVGPGTGTGGRPGGATRAEIFAKRWNFGLEGDPREHLQKLVAAGIKLGFVDNNNLFNVIDDLKNRPVTHQFEAYEKYKDCVQWWNIKPSSVFGLSRELGMKTPPKAVVMFLPSEREQVLADAELKFAKDRNRDLNAVTETVFDFRVVGGAIEPIVVGQAPFEFPAPRR